MKPSEAGVGILLEIEVELYDGNDNGLTGISFSFLRYIRGCSKTNIFSL